ARKILPFVQKIELVFQAMDPVLPISPLDRCPWSASKLIPFPLVFKQLIHILVSTLLRNTCLGSIDPKTFIRNLFK
ncbi:MAG: hypothetical protein QXF58_06950, partial [Desulfurococcaceae archaeon]